MIGKSKRQTAPMRESRKEQSAAGTLRTLEHHTVTAARRPRTGQALAGAGAGMHYGGVALNLGNPTGYGDQRDHDFEKF
jgi:hypothetical protein